MNVKIRFKEPRQFLTRRVFVIFMNLLLFFVGLGFAACDDDAVVAVQKSPVITVKTAEPKNSPHIKVQTHVSKEKKQHD